MPTTEHTINDTLASLLRATRNQWKGRDAVRSENTGVLKRSAKRPDILVAEPHVSPVVVETEVVPASQDECTFATVRSFGEWAATSCLQEAGWCSRLQGAGGLVIRPIGIPLQCATTC